MNDVRVRTDGEGGWLNSKYKLNERGCNKVQHLKLLRKSFIDGHILGAIRRSVRSHQLE